MAGAHESAHRDHLGHASRCRARGFTTRLRVERCRIRGRCRGARRRPQGRRRIDVPLLGKKPLGWRTLRELRRRAKDVDVVIAYGSTTLPACAISMLGLSTPFLYRSIGDPDRVDTQRLASSAHRLPDSAGTEDRRTLAQRCRFDLRPVRRLTSSHRRDPECTLDDRFQRCRHKAARRLATSAGFAGRGARDRVRRVDHG